MSSSVKIGFGLFDVTAREDASFVCTDKQPFTDLSDLKAEKPLRPPKAATLEEDFFLLDGTFEPFPAEPEGLGWGLWSESMSGADGRFAVPPVLVVSFAGPHSSMGLTLTFAPDIGDYASELEVQWYDGAGNLLAQRRFYPDGPQWYLDQKVEGYRRLVLTFLSTVRPFRYLKLRDLRYGLDKELKRENIASASILEEMDPTSAELSINTLRCTLHSKDADFSLLNPKGMFSVLQQRQKLRVTELVDGEEVQMGTYYLDSWENGSENSVDLSAIDLVGVIDQTYFPGGMYQDVTVSALIGEIMASADAEYTLDETLAGKRLTGYLPICTHREALQQAAFAAGAVVDCSRSDRIRIYPPPDRPSSYIRRTRKFSGGSVKLGTLVTGVEVVAHRYLPNSESTELFSEELGPGEYEITFDSPAHTLSISGGSILESSVNRAVIRVEKTGKVVLSGLGYTDTKQVVTRRLASIPANAAPNTLRVEEATLVSSGNAGEVAQRLLNHYQQRYEAEFTVVVGAERLGDKILVDSLRGEKLKGVVEALDVDLTGGFRGVLKLAGVRIETLTGDYLGERYSGETLGVV